MKEADSDLRSEREREDQGENIESIRHSSTTTRETNPSKDPGKGKGKIGTSTRHPCRAAPDPQLRWGSGSEVR